MRVVCTQPFNNNFPFGLSYLYINQKNIQSSASPSSSSSTSTTTSSSTPKSDKSKISGSENNNEDADTDVDEESAQASSQNEKIKRENSALIKKLKKEMQQKNKEEEDNNSENESKQNNQKNNKKKKENNTQSTKNNHESDEEKPTQSADKQKNTKQQKGKDNATPKGKDKPTNTILKGVVFAISGIQNPERGEIREKGTALGAVYKQNWDNECTHLICKFANTPKYLEVKGKGGIIATPQWIADCATKGKKLNLTKKYSLEEDKPSLSADSTAEKKKKKKKNKVHDPNKGYDSDPDDDSDGGPNEYNLRDSFIDNSTDPNLGEDEDFEPDSDELQTSDEDVSELMRETKAFLKKEGGLKKRPRYEYIEEDENAPQPNKHPKTNNNHKTSEKGKTFTKQQHKSAESSEKPSKPSFQKKPHQSETPKHHSTAIHNGASDEEDDEERLTKYKPKSKATAIQPAEGSASEGTEEMGDDEVKEKFKHLIPTSNDDSPQKAKGNTPKPKKQKQPSDDELPQKARENTPKPKKQKLTSDDHGSGTEEMKDVDFPRGKTGNYQSDNSDSDGTQPLEKDELMNVIGALQAEAAGDGTLPIMDGETNWEDLVNKKMTAKSKEKAALGKTYPVEQLPDFLAPVQAFFSGVRKNEHLLRRYIIAYNGKIDDYLGDDTKYIFTEKPWDRNFNDALKVNPDLVFVKPDWIFACHAKQALVDVNRYVITNNK
eukprot:Phypoly_transcript_01247.p1 GENE.Phypoly_transcript_01247~~Phypoly_transcript_01247.p1  ORF type:complete len:774 (+),score=245.44 Phypoly_transcript_01247:170-2323(+)